MTQDCLDLDQPTRAIRHLLYCPRPVPLTTNAFAHRLDEIKAAQYGKKKKLIQKSPQCTQHKSLLTT